MSHADVEFLKVLERHFRFYRFRNVCGSLVSLLCGFEFVELLLYCLVVDFLEKEFWLAQLMSCLQKVGASELFPFVMIDIEHFQ